VWDRKRSDTVQEYRKTIMPVGKPSARDGLRVSKQVEYWGFVAIPEPNSENPINDYVFVSECLLYHMDDIHHQR